MHAVGHVATGLFQFQPATWGPAWDNFVIANPDDPLSSMSAAQAINNSDAQTQIMYRNLGKWYAGYDDGKLLPTYMPGGDACDSKINEGFTRTYQVRGAQAEVEGKDASLNDAELQVASSVWSDYQALKVGTQNVRTSMTLVSAESIHSS